MPVAEDPEAVLHAYRKARRTMWGHAIFLLLCIILVSVARRIFGMPPQVVTMVIIVALIVFGRDIMTFFHLRSKLSRMRDDLG